MFYQYRFELPPDVKMNTHTQARRLLGGLLGKLSDDESYDLEIFNRDKSGPINALAPVRIGGTPREIVIVGVGPEGVELLKENVPVISKVLSEHFNGTYDERRRIGVCSITEVPNLRHYLIPLLVFQRNNFATYREALSTADYKSPAVLKKVEESIQSGIQRQALMLDGDIPEFPILNLQVDNLVPIEVKPGVFNLCAKVWFHAPVDIEGPWHVGHLCSRGFGQIFRPGRSAQMQLPAAA